jgi:hypothetical protein
MIKDTEYGFAEAPEEYVHKPMQKSHTTKEIIIMNTWKMLGFHVLASFITLIIIIVGQTVVFSLSSTLGDAAGGHILFIMMNILLPCIGLTGYVFFGYRFLSPMPNRNILSVALFGAVYFVIIGLLCIQFIRTGDADILWFTAVLNYPSTMLALTLSPFNFGHTLYWISGLLVAPAALLPSALAYLGFLLRTDKSRQAP